LSEAQGKLPEALDIYQHELTIAKHLAKLDGLNLALRNLL
jgi:hypothetical protein